MLKYIISTLTFVLLYSCGTQNNKQPIAVDTTALPLKQAGKVTEPHLQKDTLQFVDFAMDKYFNIPSFIDKAGTLIDLYTEDTALNNEKLYGKIMEVTSTPGAFNVDDEGDKKEVHPRLMQYKILNAPPYMSYKPLLTIMDDIAHLPQVVQSKHKADVSVVCAPNRSLNAYTLRASLSSENYLRQEYFRVYQVPSYRIMHYDQQSEKEIPVGQWQVK
ncbi:MAG: hypothetical protein J0I41_05395 [Filimonas sp.]|nr:hypothetical protein [Filimonas sp.]